MNFNYYKGQPSFSLVAIQSKIHGRIIFPSAPTPLPQPLPSPRLAPRDSRGSTPEHMPTLSSLSDVASPGGRTVTKRASNLSMSSASDGEVRKEETPPADVEIKEEEDEDD